MEEMPEETNNIFSALQEELEGDQDYVELSEAQFLFANLLYKTDFTEEEISEVMEWEPSDEELDEIYEKVNFWRSSQQENSKFRTHSIIL